MMPPKAKRPELSVYKCRQLLSRDAPSAELGSPPSSNAAARLLHPPAGPVRLQSAGLVTIRCVCRAQSAPRDARGMTSPRDCPLLEAGGTSLASKQGASY